MKKILSSLFVLTNLSTISLSIGERGTKSEYDRFDETCPKFWRRIGDTIKQHATNCTHPSSNGFKSHKMALLENVCLLTNGMLSVICEKIDGDFGSDLDLNSTQNDSICPLSLNLVDVSRNLSRDFVDAERILANRSLCLNVCYDLDKIEERCIVLLKVHNCLENWAKTSTRGKNEKTSPQVTETDSFTKGSNSTKVVNVVVNTNEKKPSDERTEMLLLNDGYKVQDEKEGSNKEKIEKQIVSVLQPASSNGNSFSRPYVDNRKDQNEANEDAIANTSRTEKKTQDTAKFSETMDVDDAYDKSEGFNKVEEYQESGKDENQSTLPKGETYRKIINQNGIYSEEGFFQAEDSHFFFYFLTFMSIVIIGYFAFHNKKKILAYALEGRNNRHASRRSNLAKYKKLESNLEEAIASNETHPSSSSIVY